MKKIFFLIFLFATLGMSAQVVNISISKDIQTKNGKSFYVHTVKKGQTVYSIAKAYHVGIDEIYYYNPTARNGLQVGQKLWIPTENKETEITNEVKQKNFDFFYHVASQGETLDHVSSIYLVPKKYLLLANPGITSPLKEGEYIKIPVEEAYPILEGKIKPQKNTPVYKGGLNQTPTFKPAPKPKVEKLQSGKKTLKKKTTEFPKQKRNTQPLPTISNYMHIAVSGETLQDIAKKYKISVAELKAVNPGLIMVVKGQRLRLPINAKVPGYNPTSKDLKAIKQFEQRNKPKVLSPVEKQKHYKTQSSTTGYFNHIVKKKETLYSISRKYGINLNDLYKANPGLTTNIKIGQSIRIPKKKINNPFVLYSPIEKIKLKKIAKLYQIDYQDLVRVNPFIKHKVYPGELVRIPTGLTPYRIKNNNEVQGENVTQSVGSTQKTQLTSKGCEARPHNRIFKVALMVPLYLQDADSLNRLQFMLQRQTQFPPFRFIQFLQGGLLAAQAMKEQGMNLEFYVFDVDETLTKAAKVLSKPDLKKMDLIIGPFYSRSFEQVSLFANHFNIPIVNPLTFRESVIARNKNIIKVKPGLSYLPGEIKRLVQNEYKQDKVFVISQNTYSNHKSVSALTDSVLSALPATIKYSNDTLAYLGVEVTQREKLREREELIKLQPLNQKPNSQNDSLLNALQEPIITKLSDTLQPYILENQPVFPDSLKLFPEDSTTFSNTLVQIYYSQDSLHPFISNASVLRDNLVIIYGNNKAFVMDVMNRLNVIRDTFHIKMIGLPLWENLTNLDLYQMNNLNVTYPSSYFVNYESPAVKALDSLFYKNYGTIAEKYGITGFDITYYFLNALYYYGPKMIRCIPNFPFKGIGTEYHFEAPETNPKNLENNYWNMLRIENLRYIHLPDSVYYRH